MATGCMKDRCWTHDAQYRKFLEDTQVTVSGKVFVTLQPYRFTVTGIESAHDLMSSKLGSYGEMNKGWSGDDVKGFCKNIRQPIRYFS